MSGASTKAGGDPAPVTLTMGTDDATGKPAADQVEEFARQVKSRSGGTLQIEPRLQAIGPPQPAWDQKVLRLVVEGDLDLGMIPSRAWDTEGVDTLRALNAPFVLTTDEAVNTVVTDDELAADLMEGLDEVGVTGLALVPESLRHLFLYDKTALSADDLHSVVVRSPRSRTVWGFLEALGAHPTDSPADKSYTLVESSFGQAPPGGRRAAVGNVTLFPKINVVAANADLLAGLSDEQRDVLREAALATRDWAISQNRPDQDQAAAWCEDGKGDVTHVSDDVVSALHTAAATVVDELSKDQHTAELISRLQDVSGPDSVTSLPECRSSRAAPASMSASDLSPTGGDLPNGTYRAEYTDAYLRARVRLEENVRSNHGVWTFQLEDGHWVFDQDAPDIVDHEEGVYEVRGKHLYWALDETSVLHFIWSTDKDGDLHFDQVRDQAADSNPDYPFPDFQFDLEWVRVK
jgi:TRAP-type C4-dicarboxylate transport system substrate-binding protein